MPQFVYVVALIAYFTELTCISYGECNDGNLQKSVYCSTKRFEKVSCRVEGIVMITNMTINQQNQTKSCSLSAYNGDPNYGKNENAVWVDNGCSAVFEICGKTNKSFSSETVVPSTSSTAHLTSSTAGSILPTGATEYSHSNPFTSSPTAQSLKTTEATKAAADKSPQHDETNTLSTNAIAGIIAGGCVFILLCVLYVYIVSSSDPCNRVTPSSRV